jgi:hypothetical protein
VNSLRRPVVLSPDRRRFDDVADAAMVIKEYIAREIVERQMCSSCVGFEKV